MFFSPWLQRHTGTGNCFFYSFLFLSFDLMREKNNKSTQVWVPNIELKWTKLFSFALLLRKASNNDKIWMNKSIFFFLFFHFILRYFLLSMLVEKKAKIRHMLIEGIQTHTKTHCGVVCKKYTQKGTLRGKEWKPLKSTTIFLLLTNSNHLIKICSKLLQQQQKWESGRENKNRKIQ